MALRLDLRTLPWRRKLLILGGALAALLALIWLGTSMASHQRPAPFTPGVADQREVEVGGEKVDLDEVERASHEADAVARQLEAELGGVQEQEPESR